tara:strand:- start:128 stop:1207 length:1080 start_codon:yes stop_codon:yes gene_type:complete
MIFTLKPHNETSLQPLLLELFKTDILHLTFREMEGVSNNSWLGLRSEITQFVSENSIKLIIIDAIGDPVILDNTIYGYGPSYLDMQSDLKKICKSIIITEDFTYYYKPVEDVFFLGYNLWIQSTRNIHKYYDYQDTVYDTDLEKTHPLMCLNRNLVWHRIYMLMLMYNKTWINKVDFSFILPMGNRLENKPIISKYITKEEKQVIRLIPTPIFLDYEDPNDIPVMYSHGASNVNGLAYTRNAINLVTETSLTDGIALTEKTAKAIMAYQIPILVTNPGQCQFLEDIGIDMFSDYIPWRDWDQIENHKERMQKIVDFVDTIMQDTNAILKTHQDFHPRLIKNKERFHSDEFSNLLLKQIP